MGMQVEKNMLSASSCLLKCYHSPLPISFFFEIPHNSVLFLRMDTDPVSTTRGECFWIMFDMSDIY